MEYYVTDFKNRDELDNKIKTDGNPKSDMIMGSENELKSFNLSPKRTVYGVRIIKI